MLSSDSNNTYKILSILPFTLIQMILCIAQMSMSR